MTPPWNDSSKLATSAKTLSPQPTTALNPLGTWCYALLSAGRNARLPQSPASNASLYRPRHQQPQQHYRGDQTPKPDHERTAFLRYPRVSCKRLRVAVAIVWYSRSRCTLALGSGIAWYDHRCPNHKLSAAT